MFSSSIKPESDWLKNMSDIEENLTQIKVGSIQLYNFNAFHETIF